MKVGDLVKLCKIGYPQYSGMVGVLIRYGTNPASSTPWAVMINGKIHSYYIHQADMELVV
jgi:hypothetical protein|tara:strand:+ start:291 stop:470 length:180 start_codon:yes stop_codon:yes gene_type:complete